MKPNLDWLLNQRLSQVEKKDFTWFFSFENGGSVSIDSAWRLITNDGLIATSEDHGHPFGLPEPVDAGKRVMAAVQNKRVLNYSCTERVSDLIIHFENERMIWFENIAKSK